MKMNRKCTLAFWALLICFATVLPMLTACSGGGLEIPTEEEEEVTITAEEQVSVTVEQAATQTEEEVVDPSLNDPNWDYIPPENYIDYTDNEGLNATQNIGGKGQMVTAGGNPVMSYISYQEYLKANEKTLFTAADRRQSAEAEMRAMLSVLWTPKEDTLYSFNPSAYKDRAVQNAAEFAKNQINLKAGKIYQGLPFTHGSSNAATFLLGLTAENGVYTVDVSTELLSGSTTKRAARWGNNAVDALFWGWAKVAPSVSFKDFKEMTKAYGVLPVGEYEISDAAEKSISNATLGIIEENGEEKMLAAYSKLQKADGLVCDTKEYDHAMMVVSVNPVFLADGSIDPAASTVTVLEQTEANLVNYENLSDAEKEAKAGETLVIGGIDVQYTFRELLDKGFIPVTCKELNEDGALPDLYVVDTVRTTLAKSSNFAGSIVTNRRIVYAVMTIKDAEGNVLQQSTAFPMEAAQNKYGQFQFELKFWTGANEIKYRRGNIYTTSTYIPDNTKVTHTLEVFLSTGESKVIRNYSYAI